MPGREPKKIAQRAECEKLKTRLLQKSVPCSQAAAVAETDEKEQDEKEGAGEGEVAIPASMSVEGEGEEESSRGGGFFSKDEDFSPEAGFVDEVRHTRSFFCYLRSRLLFLDVVAYTMTMKNYPYKCRCASKMDERIPEPFFVSMCVMYVHHTVGSPAWNSAFVLIVLPLTMVLRSDSIRSAQLLTESGDPFTACMEMEMLWVFVPRCDLLCFYALWHRHSRSALIFYVTPLWRRSPDVALSTKNAVFSRSAPKDQTAIPAAGL